MTKQMSLTKIFSQNYELITIRSGIVSASQKHSFYNVFYNVCIYVNHTIPIIFPMYIEYTDSFFNNSGTTTVPVILGLDITKQFPIREKIENILKKYNNYLLINNKNMFNSFIKTYLSVNIEDRDEIIKQTILPPLKDYIKQNHDHR